MTSTRPTDATKSNHAPRQDAGATTQDTEGGGASEGRPRVPASIMRWAIGLRDAYGEGRLSATALLARVALALARAASRPDREVLLRTALNEAFSKRSVEGAALRVNIETLVEGGEMQPSAAESWAQSFGWPPFAGWADPAKFDPMAEAFWTLPMTAAWIRWHKLDRLSQAYIDDGTDRDATKDYWRKRDFARVVEQVRRHWHTNIAASTRWMEVEYPALPDDEHQPSAKATASRTLEQARRGYVVAPREDRGWSDLPGETTETRRILCEALRSKLLQAERYYDGAFKPIPEDEWSALTIVGFHDDDGVHRVFAPDGAEYLVVRIPRKQVVTAFPFRTTEQEAGKDARRKVGRTELRQLVEATRRDDGTIPNADDLEDKFRADGLQVGRTPLRDMVKELSGRDGPGRPPKIRT